MTNATSYDERLNGRYCLIKQEDVGEEVRLTSNILFNKVYWQFSSSFTSLHSFNLLIHTYFLKETNCNNGSKQGYCIQESS